MDVGVLEAKNRFSELLARAEQGEPVTITRRGKPVATLNGVTTPVDMDKIRKLVAEVEETRKTLPPITREEIRAAIHEGRRY